MVAKEDKQKKKDILEFIVIPWDLSRSPGVALGGSGKNCKREIKTSNLCRELGL